MFLLFQQCAYTWIVRCYRATLSWHLFWKIHQLYAAIWPHSHDIFPEKRSVAHTNCHFSWRFPFTVTELSRAQVCWVVATVKFLVFWWLRKHRKLSKYKKFHSGKWWPWVIPHKVSVESSGHPKHKSMCVWFNNWNVQEIWCQHFDPQFKQFLSLCPMTGAHDWCTTIR